MYLIPFFWSKQYGSSLRYLGYAPEFDKVVFRGDLNDQSFLAGFYHGGRLCAAASVGKDRELIKLGQLMEDGKSLRPEQLENPEFDLLAL